MAIKFWEKVSHEFQRGWATIEAELRRGLKDAQNFVLNPWNGFIATHEEAGTIGTITKYMITNDIQGNRGRDGRGRSASQADDVQPATHVMSAHPLQGLERLNTEIDIRRKRRALLPDEVSRLSEAARMSDVTVQGYTGIARVRIYNLAYMTGLRRNELASLTPGNFQLRAEQPTLTVEAAFSKHRRKDVLPLHPELITFLKPWFDTLPPDEPLFPQLARRHRVRMVKHDLEQAGIEYKTRDGVADFHAAGRHTYITELLRNGTSLPEAKELARHADISMTMRYTHIGLADRAKAIAKLPTPNFHSALYSTSNGWSLEPISVPAANPPALHQRCNPSVAARPAPSHAVTTPPSNPRDNSQPGQHFDVICHKPSPTGKMDAVGGTPRVFDGRGNRTEDHALHRASGSCHPIRL